jgi:Zn-finger nucleic acid-binding protein
LDLVVSPTQSAVAGTLCLRNPNRTQDACVPMQAQTLNCPNCGAAISSDSPQCQYCESKLATIACASCFGMLFIGNKHCPHCGAAAINTTPADLSILKCPRCTIDMKSVTIGNAPVRECSRCEGLWLDAHVFQLICADREHQSVILGDAFANEPKPHVAHESPVRYVPCPHCQQLMNRVNFAKCSDVIVDVCKGHGTWFDKDELRQIVEFIRGGGMEQSREKLRHEIEFQQEKLRNEQLRGEGKNVTLRMASVTRYSSDDEFLGDLSSAGGLLKFLIE